MRYTKVSGAHLRDSLRELEIPEHFRLMFAKLTCEIRSANSKYRNTETLNMNWKWRESYGSVETIGGITGTDKSI